MILQETIERSVLLLVSLNDRRQVASALVDKLGVAPDEVDEVIGQALHRIRKAADFDSEQQTGLAMVRLNDLYQRALSVQDVKTALQTQKEIQKLTNRYADVKEREWRRKAPKADPPESTVLSLLAEIDTEGEAAEKMLAEWRVAKTRGENKP